MEHYKVTLSEQERAELQGRYPMSHAGTTGTPTLNKHIRRASVSVVPEGTIDEPAVIREGGSFTDGTQLLAEAAGRKTTVSSAIDKNGIGYGV